MIAITITRGNDQWVTSYDVWAKIGEYPMQEGDGAFVGNYPISRNETFLTIEYDRPEYENWLFSALPIYNRTPGAFNQLSGA